MFPPQQLMYEGELSASLDQLMDKKVVLLPPTVLQQSVSIWMQNNPSSSDWGKQILSWSGLD